MARRISKSIKVVVISASAYLITSTALQGALNDAAASIEPQLRGAQEGLVVAPQWSRSNKAFRLTKNTKPNKNARGTTGRSDIRLKCNITLVQRLANGLNLYRFRYRWSDQFYVGVMAHEVALVCPDAVVRGTNGYLRVNYAHLGLRLMTWDGWSRGRGQRSNTGRIRVAA